MIILLFELLVNVAVCGVRSPLSVLMLCCSGRVTNLRRVTYVVMDEADRMFDMGFEPQVSLSLLELLLTHITLFQRY